MIVVLTFFVSCSKEEPLTTTTEVQKTKNISSKSGFTPKGKLIIENNSIFQLDLHLVCSGGSINISDPNTCDSDINSVINPNIDLSQSQFIDGFSTTTYTDFLTNTSTSTNWYLSIDNAQPTQITYTQANDQYMMPLGFNIYYVAWIGFKGKLMGTITDPDNLSYSETFNARTSCYLDEVSINYGNFGWEFPELSFPVNFVNHTKLILTFTAEVLANGDTVLRIKQVLD